MNRSMVLVFSIYAATCGADAVRGQIEATYDASYLTTPDQQGWTKGIDPDVSENACPLQANQVCYSAETGILEQSTLPYSVNQCTQPGQSQPQFLSWSRNLSNLSFDDGAPIVASFRLRISDSQYAVNPCSDWARPGFVVRIFDDDSKSFNVGFGNDQVFLANSAYIGFNDPGLVEEEFDATDGFHDYRLEMRGSNACLIADDVEIASLSTFGAPSGPLNSARIVFGDGTNWANSRFELEWIGMQVGCLGDMSADNIVNEQDVAAFVMRLNGPEFNVSCSAADMDGDGDGDLADFAVFQRNFGTNCPIGP